MSDTIKEINGIDVFNDDMIITNDGVARGGIPFIWGSGSTLHLSKPQSGYSLQIPSYGFMLGVVESLCLEFWIKIEDMDAVPPTDDVLSSSVEIIKFSENSFLKLYKNQLLLTYWKEFIQIPFDSFGFPMLVNINYMRKGSLIYVSALVDGVVVASQTFKYISQEKTDFIYFSNGSNYKIVLGPVVMYPYNITADMATKHFVYGQGTEVPLSYKEVAGGSLAELDERFTRKQLQAVKIPSSLSWESGRIFNLQNNDNVLRFRQLRPPIQVKDNLGNNRYYFEYIQEYYSKYPFAFGVNAKITRHSPDLKYVLAVFRLIDNFIVLYWKNDTFAIDFKIDETFVENVASFQLINYFQNRYVLDAWIVFEDIFREIELIAPSFGFAANEMIRDMQTKITVGYIDEDINGESRSIDDITPAPDYYYNMESIEEVPIVRFLDSMPDLFQSNPLIENSCINGTVTWLQTYNKFYQWGSWGTEFPISLLTDYIDYTNAGGWQNKYEQLDYIQYNISNETDTTSLLLIKYANDPDPEMPSITPHDMTLEEVQINIGEYQIIENNQIVKLPVLSPESYKDLVVRLIVIVDSNVDGFFTERFNLEEIKLVGSSQTRSTPMVVGTVADTVVVPFERTAGTLFPKWHTDVQLLTPSINMPFYYLNKQQAHAIVDNGNWAASAWDKGFLIEKNFVNDGSDEIYGYSAFINVESNPAEDEILKFTQLNYIDYISPNRLGDVSIRWEHGEEEGLFSLIKNETPGHEFELYLDDVQIMGVPYEYFKTNRWYIFTVIFKNKVKWDSRQTKSIYLEFLAPHIYITNPNILSLNIKNEIKAVVDYYINTSQIVNYLNLMLVGSMATTLMTADTENLSSIIQNAWTSAYINVVWENVSVQVPENI